VTRELLVANNCHLPVKFLFSGKDGSGSRISEPWIEISQTQGSLITGQTLKIQIDIMIDRRAVAQVLHKIRDASSGVKIPLDILVLHVVNGRDIFITIFGEFKPSCFGLSMEALTKLVKPVTHYELKDLMQIEREKDVENLIEISNPMVVPREIWLLIDYLFKNGLATPNLFTQSRKYSLNPTVNEIRDWLDTWSELPFPGTPHTAAEALLFLLEATPDPVVNISARECAVNCDYFERCRELILRQKPVKRKIFLYICLFLRELQKNYTSNRMDDHFLGE
jgi:inositol polyphosphate 5-phosphatase INPP5B/F